jgi:hypothetical protein
MTACHLNMATGLVRGVALTPGKLDFSTGSSVAAAD